MTFQAVFGDLRKKDDLDVCTITHLNEKYQNFPIA